MANGGGANKPEPLQPHPVMEQLAGVQYCINSPPPWLEALLLGFQHYILSLGTIVLIPSMLVPQMGGGNEEKARVIQTLLLTSGLSTLMQSIFGSRLPTIATGSYAFLIPTFSIIQARQYETIQVPYQRFSDTMRGIQGAIMIAGACQVFLGVLGIWRNLVKFLSPLSVVPLVSFTGLGLCFLSFSKMAECFAVGIPELVAIFVISQFLPQLVASKSHIWDRYAILFSVVIIWFYACILTWSGAYRKSRDVLTTCRTDRSGLVAAAPWVYVPLPFQWGTPTFDAGEAIAMTVASFVASIESTGTFLATARYGSATPVPSSVLSRGIGWMGVGTTLGGLFGNLTGSTASVENAGALALTRVGSRRVVQISAAFMIFFSLFGKFGAVFASIPFPIVAAINIILLGCVSSSGLSHLQFCNLNSFRIKIILACSFSLGLSVPHYFREYQITSNRSPVHTDSRWFNDTITVIFMSHATVAGLVALVMDCTLPRGSDETLKDSGKPWWEKFVDYHKDVRSDEFYKLPCQLNNFWPPL